MPHSTGDIKKIPTLARNLSEDDLTFLDDVPDVQIQEFLEWVTKNSALTKWYFTNHTTLRAFERDEWPAIVEYFKYLLQLEPHSD